MSRVGGKIRVGRVTPIQQFFFFGLMHATFMGLATLLRQKNIGECAGAGTDLLFKCQCFLLTCRPKCSA